MSSTTVYTHGARNPRQSGLRPMTILPTAREGGRKGHFPRRAGTGPAGFDLSKVVVNITRKEASHVPPVLGRAPILPRPPTTETSEKRWASNGMSGNTRSRRVAFTSSRSSVAENFPSCTGPNVNSGSSPALSRGTRCRRPHLVARKARSRRRAASTEGTWAASRPGRNGKADQEPQRSFEREVELKVSPLVSRSGSPHRAVLLNHLNAAVERSFSGPGAGCARGWLEPPSMPRSDRHSFEPRPVCELNLPASPAAQRQG